MSEAYSSAPAADADGADPAAPPAAAPKLRYSDADFLRIVGDERRRSIGFGEGDTGELARVRIKAQEYGKGQINDLKSIKGRSQAVDTTFSDSVDTLMPDVMEVFFGGDDVVTFDADSPGDEEQAREESDVLNQIVFGQNDAFRAFHDAFKDAFENRIGLFHWWWEEDERPLRTQTAQDPVQAAAMAAIVGQQIPWAQAKMEIREDGTIVIGFSELRGSVCFKAAPSEDFTVAADTVAVREGAYCALRDRVRVQDLIARGVDKELARSLPHYTTRQDEMERARDQSGEDDRASEDGIDDMRLVEVRTHYLRVDADDDGDVEIWRIETDSEEAIFLQKECVSQIPFGALTPYLQAHRFHGMSLFDKLVEAVKIKTVLLRMLLDSGYFALNQRYEVSEEAANEFTIADLLNNAPNVPVRSKNGQAVRPLAAGELGFDVMGALEFMSTVAEQRSGVVRNAQGLNPDTLHDTASGMHQLIAAANKRVRMICRTFAETGVKDLFLGIHQMLREQFTAQHAPINHKAGPDDWKQIRPDSWPERSSLTVHVGVGSSGKDRDVAVQSQAIALTKEIIELQGGVQGPFVTPPNVFNRLKAFSRAMGERSPEQFWTDPGAGPQAGEPGAPGAPGAPPPNPEMLKQQAAAQLEQQRLAADTQAAQLKAQNDLAIARERLKGELAIKQAEMEGKLQLQREQAAQDLDLQRQEMLASMDLRRQQLMAGVAHSPNVGEAVEALPGGPG